MGKKIIDDTTLQNIADSIRSKKGLTKQILVKDFSKEIDSIECENDCSNLVSLIIGGKQ